MDTIRSILLSCAAFVAIIAGESAAESRSLRVGHFPNVTHGQALLAKATGSYEEDLGEKIEWVQFNAGPSAIEALFSNEIDATYIGPTPAVNGYLKSKGAALVIVAGGAQGGAGLVVRADSGISSPKDLAGKQITTPQLGNTQDIAARHFLKGAGISLREKGGETALLPLANADSLSMFQRKLIDAAWTVEPWVSRLEVEGGGKLLVDEKDLWPGGKYPTTVLVFSKKFLKERPEIAEKLVAAHIKATDRLNGDRVKTGELINEELKRETGKALSAEVLARSLSRVTFDITPLKKSLAANLAAAQDVGFAPADASIEGIWDLTVLQKVASSLGKSISEE